VINTSHAELVLKLDDQFKDLRLDRHIEPVVGSSAITEQGDKPAPLLSSRAGEPPRQLKRIAAHGPLGVRKTHERSISSVNSVASPALTSGGDVATQ